MQLIQNICINLVLKMYSLIYSSLDTIILLRVAKKLIVWNKDCCGCYVQKPRTSQREIIPGWESIAMVTEYFL